MKILVLNHKEDALRKYCSALNIVDANYFFTSEPVISVVDLIEQINPDIVITSLEWLPYQRMIVSEANSRGIPTLYVVDGILEWSYIWNNQSYVIPNGTVFQPLISANIAVIGPHQARILASMGIPKEKINIIGLPRLDNFERVRHIKIGEKPRILICTANTPYHNALHQMVVREALFDLKDVIENELQIECLWRIDTNLAYELGVQTYNETLDDVLKEVTAVIAFPSTIILESMLLEIPTAIIEYRTDPLYVDTAWQIRCRKHIYAVVQELLSPSMQKIAYQNYCLNEELNFGNSGPELIKLICRLIDNKMNVGGGKSSLDYFGKLDYNNVHSQLSLFSASSNSRLQYELDAYKKHFTYLHYKHVELSNRLSSLYYFRICMRFPNLLYDAANVKEILSEVNYLANKPLKLTDNTLEN